MKRIRVIYKILAIILMLGVVATAVPNMNTLVVAQAATTVKISKTALTLEVGKTSTLTMKGTTKKVTWTTSDKTIATVSSKGKVTAKKAGKATITATVDKKKYTCKVTVKAKTQTNTFLTKAPFAAKEITLDKFKMVVPKDWELYQYDSMDYIVALIYSTSIDQTEDDYSHLRMFIYETGEKAPSNDEIRDYIAEQYTESSITIGYITPEEEAEGIKVTLSDLNISELKGNLGNVFKIEYTITKSNGDKEEQLKQIVYHQFINNYEIQLVAYDYGTALKTPLNVVGDYIFKSLQVMK